MAIGKGDVSVRALSVSRGLVGAVVLLAVTAACARSKPGQHTPAPSHEVLTSADLQGQGFSTVLEAIESLRGNWLEKHGTNSFRTPSEIKVYVDGTMLGGIDQLNTIPLASVVYIRHYDGVTATARWGVGHGNGVIYISTHPNNDPI
jgi:hypothetical protein